MSRRLSQQFNCRALAGLTRQLLVAPADRRIEQVRRAEALHDQIDPQRNYPFDFVNFRITGYHSESKPDELLVGEAAQPDLRLLIDSLSRSVGMPRTEKEPIVTPAQLADRLNVSTKTIERWRKSGLRWRWVEPAAGQRQQVVFTQEAVDLFLESHGNRVERAQRFSQMTPDQRGRLFSRARQLAADPSMTHFRAARVLAGELGRAIETIRLLLEQHDREHPSDRIFSDHKGPLSARQKQVIDRAARKRISVDKIARHFRRSKASISRIIRERRAAALHRRKITYVASPMFERDDADDVLLRALPPTPAAPSPRELKAALADLPVELRSIYDQAMLPEEYCVTLITRMNYLKFKAASLRESLHRYDPSEAALRQIESYLSQAEQIRPQLIRAALPLVLIVAHQQLAGRAEAAAVPLIDLLQIGNDELFDTIVSYDRSQSQSLRSNLRWRLRRRYAQHEPSASRARRRLTADAMVEQLYRAAATADVTLPTGPA